jgi:subtilisin family serine protease
MRWYRSHTAAKESRFGSAAVIGLVSMRDLAGVTQSYGLTRVRSFPSLHAAQVRVDRAQLRALLAAEQSDARLRYVAPVGPRRRVTSLPSDPLVQTVDPATRLPYEWQFASAKLEGGFDLTPGDPRIQVGVIDTGVDNVPDLRGKIDGLYDVDALGRVQAHSGDGNDDFGHGTAVASLIAAGAGDGFGMTGFGGAAHVIGVHAGAHGSFADGDIAQALAKLDSLGVRIVNLSLGGVYPPSPILVDAINKAAGDGMLIVAAAGNEGLDVSYPAALLQQRGGAASYGLAVGATNVDGSVADFSNFGDHLSLVAPGNFAGDCTGVLVALPPKNELSTSCYKQWRGAGGAQYGYVAGTSFSAPEVAGVAALVWAARPELENYQVADIVKASADRDPGTGWTPALGCGRLDAEAAVELALSRTAAEWASLAPVTAAPCSAADGAPAALAHSQEIVFAPLRDRTTADGAFRLHARASSGLPITYFAYGPCTIRHSKVHATRAGLCAIQATQPGNDRFAPARPVTRVVSITWAAIPKALPAAGEAGGVVSLRYRASAFSRVETHVVVKRGSRTVARLHRGAADVEPGTVYSVAWRARHTHAGARLHFCVTLHDRTPGAPARSFTSCAPIRLRTSS